jgi:hypothetical protein
MAVPVGNLNSDEIGDQSRIRRWRIGGSSEFPQDKDCRTDVRIIFPAGIKISGHIAGKNILIGIYHRNTLKNQNCAGDDHQLFRNGLKILLGGYPEFEWLPSIKRIELLKVLENCPADIVLMI